MAVVVVVFIVLAVTLHHPAFHRHLLSILKRAAGIEITFVDSEVHLLRSVVILRGVEARGSRGRFNLQADRILFNLSSLSVIRGKFIITDLEVDRPVVSISRSEGASKPPADLIPKIFERFERSFLLQNTILDRGVVRDLTLRYGEGREIRLREATLRLLPTLLREIRISLELADASSLSPSLTSLGLDVTVKRDGIKLKRLKAVTPKLALEVSGRWNGTLEKGRLILDGRLEVPRLLSDTLHFGLDAALEERVATIKRIRAKLEDASFEGEGRFWVDSLVYDLKFSAKDLALESIFGKMPGAVLGPARGTGDAEGRAQGALPRLHAEAEAKIHNLTHHALGCREAEGTLRLNWPDLDFQARGMPGTDRRTQLTVDGGVTFKHVPGREKLQAVLRTLTLDVENASIEDVVPTLKVSGGMDGTMTLQGAEGTSVQGTAHAHVTAGHWFLGPIDSLETDIVFRPGGKVSFAKTAVRIPYVEPFTWPGLINLETSGEAVLFSGDPAPGIFVKGSYHKGSEVFRIDSLRVGSALGSLEGSAGYFPGGRIEARLQGPFDLEWLRLVPSLFREGRGVARLNLSASGPLKDPQVRGRIEFAKNDLEIRGFPQEIANLEGVLALEGSTFVPSLSGDLGDGRFHLEGRIGTIHWKPSQFDLRFEGNNLTFSQINIYRVDFDAAVTLKGSLPAPRLEGRIDIVDGRYVKNFAIRELVLKPTEVPVEPRPWEKAVAPVALALSVKNSGDLEVRNNVARLLLRCDLQVSGTYGHPRIGGTFAATEGEFRYLGEDFILTEGRLEFLDPSRSDPYLTLQAQQEIPPDYSVFVGVDGFLSNLEVSLSSSPSLPREDILSLIAFGMTREEIRQSGRSRRSLTAEILAGEISGVLERPVSRKTGLDIFRLEASEKGSISVLALGKRVTDRLTVEFRNDLAPESAERTVQANYYLTDNILLKGFRTREAGKDPRYQVNMSFRFRLY